MSHLRLLTSPPREVTPDEACLAAFQRELDYVYRTLRRLGHLAVGDRRSGARGVPGAAQVLDRLRSGATVAALSVRHRLSDRVGAPAQAQPRGLVRIVEVSDSGPGTRRRACRPSRRARSCWRRWSTFRCRGGRCWSCTISTTSPSGDVAVGARNPAVHRLLALAKGAARAGGRHAAIADKRRTDDDSQADPGVTRSSRAARPRARAPTHRRRRAVRARWPGRGRRWRRRSSQRPAPCRCGAAAPLGRGRGGRSGDQRRDRRRRV